MTPHLNSRFLDDTKMSVKKQLSIMATMKMTIAVKKFYKKVVLIEVVYLEIQIPLLFYLM